MSPLANQAIRNPAITGPRMRAKFMPVVCSAMAVKISRRGTSSGTKACRAGIEKASTVPLNMPSQMKSQKVTWSVMMMVAMKIVATQFSICAVTRMRRLWKRSASTPPHSEKKTCGTMKDSVTQARSIAEDVIV